MNRMPLLCPPISDAGAAHVIVTLDHVMCAFPVAHVVEVTRPLPIEPVPGAPRCVAGLAIVRGEQTPVLLLRALLGAAPSPPSRFLVLRADGRRVALAVDGVAGVEWISPEAVEQAPPLVSRAATEALDAIATLDGALLLVLRTARLIPESLPEDPVRVASA